MKFGAEYGTLTRSILNECTFIWRHAAAPELYSVDINMTSHYDSHSSQKRYVAHWRQCWSSR
jgi:hypothetical protein